MPITTPLSLAARERLREHQAATARVVARHSATLAHLDAAVTRRNKVVAQQDALVAASQAKVDVAVAEAATVMGVDVAAAVLGLSKAEVSRASKGAPRTSLRDTSP